MAYLCRSINNEEKQEEYVMSVKMDGFHYFYHDGRVTVSFNTEIDMNRGEARRFQMSVRKCMAGRSDGVNWQPDTPDNELTVEFTPSEWDDDNTTRLFDGVTGELLPLGPSLVDLGVIK